MGNGREREGIIPALVVLDGTVYSTSVLVEKYRDNGYDKGRVDDEAYRLAIKRKHIAEKLGPNDCGNFIDAEKLVAVQSKLEEIISEVGQ